MRIQRVPASRLDDPEPSRRRSAARRSSRGATGGPRDARSRNERVVRNGLGAYERRDPGAVRQLFSPSTRIHVEEPVEAAGDYTGLDGAVQWLLAVEQEYGPGMQLATHDVLATSQHVVVLYEVRSARENVTPLRRVAVYHVRRGRIQDLTITAGPATP